MKKQLKMAIVVAFCAVFTLIFANVYATETVSTSKDVSTEAELISAIEDTNIETIIIKNDITLKAKIDITRDLTIDGNSSKLILDIDDNAVTGGEYVIKIDTCDVNINNISLAGGNVGLLVCDANVVLTGTIDLSGNAVNGMYLTKIGSVEPFVTLKDAIIVNTTEEKDKPTICEAPILSGYPMDDPDRFYNYGVTQDNGDEQYHYYLSADNAYGTVNEQLKEQLDTHEDFIELYAYADSNVLSKELLNELRTKLDKDVYIDAKSYAIFFNTNDMKEEFTSDFDVKINITKQQPFTSDVLKDVESNLLFIDLEYDGILPENTAIGLEFEDFAIGDNPYFYYYNAEEDKIELMEDAIMDVYDDYAVVKINQASTYFISSEEIDLASANANSKPAAQIPFEPSVSVPPTPEPTTPVNPNTSDMSVLFATVLSIIAVSGFVFVGKEKLFNK